MLILNIIGGIVAIIILLFTAIIVSTPAPRHTVIRCPIGKNPIRLLNENKEKKCE